MQHLQPCLLRRFWGPWASSQLQQGCVWQACYFSTPVGEPESPRPAGPQKSLDKKIDRKPAKFRKQNRQPAELLVPGATRAATVFNNSPFSTKGLGHVDANTYNNRNNVASGINSVKLLRLKLAELGLQHGNWLEDLVWRAEERADARAALEELLSAHRALQEQQKAYFGLLLKKLTVWVLHADANDVAGQVLVCVDKLGLPISGGILRRLAFSVARGKDVSSLQTLHRMVLLEGNYSYRLAYAVIHAYARCGRPDLAREAVAEFGPLGFILSEWSETFVRGAEARMAAGGAVASGGRAAGTPESPGAASDMPQDVAGKAAAAGARALEAGTLESPDAASGMPQDVARQAAAAGARGSEAGTSECTGGISVAPHGGASKAAAAEGGVLGAGGPASTGNTNCVAEGKAIEAAAADDDAPSAAPKGPAEAEQQWRGRRSETVDAAEAAAAVATAGAAGDAGGAGEAGKQAATSTGDCADTMAAAEAALPYAAAAAAEAGDAADMAEAARQAATAKGMVGKGWWQ